MWTHGSRDQYVCVFCSKPITELDHRSKSIDGTGWVHLTPCWLRYVMRQADM